MHFKYFLEIRANIYFLSNDRNAVETYFEWKTLRGIS